MSRVKTSHVTRMNASCHEWMPHVRHESWVMSHIGMSHLTCKNYSNEKRAKMSQVTHRDETCHTCEWVVWDASRGHTRNEMVASHIRSKHISYHISYMRCDHLNISLIWKVTSNLLYEMRPSHETHFSYAPLTRPSFLYDMWPSLCHISYKNESSHK